MSNNGWIKLHRQIKDNWIWDDPDKFRAWTDILLSVNHKDKQIIFNGHPITIHAGQKLTSLAKLADSWGWTRNRVDRFIRTLTETNMITVNRTPNGTLLTVVNWAVYQGQRDSERDSERDTSEATYEATNGTPVKHKQEYKNDNNDKNDNNFFCAGALKKIPPEKSDVEAYCREKRYRGMDIDGFFEYYDLRDWKLTGGLKITDWTKAVDYWHSKGKKDAEKGQSDVVYFREFEGGPAIGGDAVPFKGGLAAEMLRRKREKNAR